MKTVGRSLDCYHKICEHLLPTILLSCFVSLISLGKICLCGLLLHFYPCFSILPHNLFLVFSFSSLSLDVSFGSFLLPQLFLFPYFTLKVHFYPFYPTTEILISHLTIFLLPNERIFLVHLKFGPTQNL